MRIQDQNLQLSAQTQFYQQQELSQGQERYVGGQLVSAQREHALSQTSRVESNLSNSQGVFSRQNDYQHKLADKSEQKFSPMQARESLQGFSGNASGNLSGDWNRFLAPNLQQAQASSDAPPIPEHLMKMVEVIESMMERMTGKPYRMQLYGFHREGESQQASMASTGSSAQAVQGEQQQMSVTLGENLQANTNAEGERVYRQTHFYESEAMRFSATGSVTTEDGRAISFAFNSQVSREFATSAQFEMRKGLVVTDPLVVNFGGQNAQLSVDTMNFDLDADGTNEQIHGLQSGSGFLALDKNGNGKIDNGSELFGPQSGNGFADLSAYDEDGNGWIDENDSVFANLQIWHQDVNGFQQLDGLLDLNVGAIALQNVASNFTYKDAENQAQAQIRASSVFLKEDGGVGSMQQIDLVV